MPATRPAASSTRWFEPSRSLPVRLLRWLWALLLCAYFAYCQASINCFLYLDLYRNGQERRPYQYRELMMYVFRALRPVHLIQSVGSRLSGLHNNPDQLIFFLISFVAITVAVVSTQWTLRRLTDDPVYSFWAGLLVVPMAQTLLATPWAAVVLPYDTPSLAFFALGIALFLHRRWLLYAAVFILAVFNRETACFLTVFVAVWEWVRLREDAIPVRQRLTRVVPGVALQAVAWLSIKAWLAHKYHLNPSESSAAGGVFITKLGYNLHEFAKPWQWPLLASVGSFLLPLLWAGRHWIGSAPLRTATFTVLPLSFAGLMIVGVITEIRIFADWVAMLAPCLALMAHNRMRPVESLRPTS